MREDRKHRAALADPGTTNHGTANRGPRHSARAYFPSISNLVHEADGESSAEAVVRSFIAAWNRNDMLAVLDHLSEEVRFHNVPAPPLIGKDAVAGFLDALGPIDSVDWTVHNILARGDVVMTERTDRFIIDGERVELGVMGIFELDDGKIIAWRSYFDLVSFARHFPALKPGRSGSRPAVAPSPAIR